MNRYSIKKNSGQALLIVLLSMAVVLTVVLSILARSITDISISTQDEDSLRAFSAAEAGVESALIIGSSIGSTEIGSASYTASVSEFAKGEMEFVNPLSLVSGESSTIWFVAHDQDGNLVCDGSNPCFKGTTINVCWGKEGTSSTEDNTPAIELTVFYTTSPGDYSTATIARAAIDPNTTRRSTNNFSEPDSGTCTISGETFQFQKTITFVSLGIPPTTYLFEDGLQYAKIKFLYNTDTSHKYGIDVDFANNALLPSQGVKVESSGVSGTANRKIDVFQSYPETPEVFDSAVFSTAGIIK